MPSGEGNPRGDGVQDKGTGYQLLEREAGDLRGLIIVFIFIQGSVFLPHMSFSFAFLLKVASNPRRAALCGGDPVHVRSVTASSGRTPALKFFKEPF